MIQVKGLSKSYGSRQLFEDVTFSMGKKERLGLLGRNGHGKSTLLKILYGLENYDEGKITTPKNYKIGYLEQTLDLSYPTILDEVVSGLPSEQRQNVYLAESILQGLGLAKDLAKMPPDKLSGGMQVRAQLAKLLVSAPDLLLLDEPTNYLDIISLKWLVQFLRQWDGELILISHDREIMAQVVSHSLVIHRGQAFKIEGGPDKLYSHLQQIEDIYEKTRQNEEKKRQDMQKFINSFRAKARAASMVQSRVKMLEKQEVKQKLQAITNLQFDFNFRPFPGKYHLEVNGLGFHYPKSAWLFENLSFSVGAKDRVAVIGKNGVGKSTLLSLISGDKKALSGEISFNPNCVMAYFGQPNVERLNTSWSIEKEIQSANSDLGIPQVRGICGAMMFSGDDAQKKIAVLSGGERSRVMLGKILASQCNFLLLDEPANHLDMESVEALAMAIEKFAGAVILVSHSEGLIHRLANKLVVFHRDRVEFFDGTYRDFLDRVGWEDEELKAQSKRGKKWPKEHKRQRAALVKERGKIVAPLKSEIQKLEKAIEAVELSIASVSQNLEEAGIEGDQKKIKDFSLELGELQSELEALYSQLEEVSRQYEGLLLEFEQKLQDLDEKKHF